ncbi:MAG: hypothetical protein LHV68_11100 [Elusimicrobia bacterium]|nr:hypothetical protein [Candidatus Liberimonas magnetica]
MKKIIFLSAVICINCSFVYAALSQKINFQGQLTNSNGSPVTGTVSMTFNIHDALTGGNTLKTITNSSVSFNENGLYNVELDLTGLNLNQDMWLGIKVGSDSEMTPRVPILPSASSIFSITAQSAQASQDSSQLGGISANSYFLKSGGTLTGQINMGNFSILTSSSIVGITKIKWADGSTSTHAASCSGADMTKATYDVNSNNSVDDSERLGGALPSIYLTKAVATTTYLPLSVAATTYLKLAVANTAYMKLSGGTLGGKLNMSNFSVISSSSIEGISKIRWADGSVSTHAASMSSADMTKSTYDTDTDNIVDNSERLGGSLPSLYLTKAVATTTYLPLAVASTTYLRLSVANTTYMKLSGGTFSGDITSSQNRLQISTNVYTVGYSSAAAFYGDGSNLSLGRSYGEMFATASADLSDVTVAGTYLKAATVTTAGDLKNFTHSSGRLTYTGTKTKIFKCSVSLTSAVAAGTHLTGYKIYKNGAPIAKSEILSVTGTTAINRSDVNLGCLAQLNQNDFLELWLTTTDAIIDVTVSYLNFSLTEVQ